MSIERRQLFVGQMETERWNENRLRSVFNQHASPTGENSLTNIEIMFYAEEKFSKYSFAFLTFNDSTCVDRCMAKKVYFHEKFHLTIKRLLPDSIKKSERLSSTSDLVIRLIVDDSSFNEENIRSYFNQYGTIVDLKMLDEDETFATCFLRFADADATDRILLDLPHFLNGQILDIHKYLEPNYVCSLSQHRFIDEKIAENSKRLYSIHRNLHDFIEPLTNFHRTKLALDRYDCQKKIDVRRKIQHEVEENFEHLKNDFEVLNDKFRRLIQRNESLRIQIDEINRRNNQMKFNENVSLSS